MRQRCIWFLFLWILAIPQLSLAEPADQTEITAIRSGPHIDKALGTNVMRYVFDVTKPVEAEGFLIVGGDSPRLAVTIKGAVPAKDANFAVDGELIKSVSYTVNSAGTQMFLELGKKVTRNDFKVFTLPGNPQANKTFRVVVDINRDSKPETKTKDKPVSLPGAELLQLRSYTHVDAATGASKIRIVLDSGVPVETAATISATPLPRLIVNIKGAAPGRIERKYDFDGTIADHAVILPGVGTADSRLVVDLPIMLEAEDYKVFTLPRDPKADRPFRVVVDINKKIPQMKFAYTPGLANKVIVIDPGHGGSDPGAIGKSGLQEKKVNLAVALRTKELLQKAGAKVVMTRETDIDVFGSDASDVEELKARTTIANNRKADVFLSIHSNSSVNRTVSGTSTYFYQKTTYDAMLAQALQQAMLQSGGLPDRRINQANFYVVKRTLMPSALIELAFLSNPNDEKLLGSPEFQSQMAQGIVKGLEQFFRQASKQGGVD